MIRWKRSWQELPEDLPVDVLPASNGEFIPPLPTAEQKQVMQLQNEMVEHWRRKFGMSRRQFVRTAMAYSIGFWAINQIYGNKWGYYAEGHNTQTTAACDLEWSPDHAGTLETVYNLPGEFIFDVQSHHVESDGMWRVTNPGFEAFFAAIWSQAGPVTGQRPGVRSDGSIRGAGAGEIDPIENLSRFHYLKELFLDSATTMTVLSAVPAAPDITQPLPIDRAIETVRVVNALSGYQNVPMKDGRTVLHAFVMPNRGSAGTVASSFGREPVYMKAEFDTMEHRASIYGDLIRGWKTYPAWGDVPYQSGWFFDDELVGQKFIEHVAYCAQKYNVRPNIATHKGFALPAFDQRAASPRDIGPAASRNPGVNFIVYHSGFDGEAQGPYGGNANDPVGDAKNGDRRVNSADRTVNSLIKSLRENNWDATAFPDPYGTGFGNVPNVYAEIGSTWRTVMGRGGGEAAHLLGKLIKFVGPKRIAWGTDSLWFGSPQSEIIALRKLKFSAAANQFYGLADGIDSDSDDPTKSTLDPASYTSNPRGIPGWPTDGKAHPERSIRNWIFGYAAAVVYGVDASAHRTDRGVVAFPEKQGDGTPYPTPDKVAPQPASASHAIACDDVQKIRDQYVINQMTPREEIPLASNQIVGPRTRRELLKMRAEQPWAP